MWVVIRAVVQVAQKGGGTTYTTADKTVEAIKPQEIGTTVGGFIRMGIYDVKANENGEISVSEAHYTVDEEASSKKYSVRTYNTKGAYIDVGGDTDEYTDGRDLTTSKGVNWDNVKSVTGKTFDMKTFLKKKGFKWNSSKKSWTK